MIGRIEMKGRILSYDDTMRKRYKKDPELSMGVLSLALQDNEEPRLFLGTLEEILIARVGDFSTVAKKAKVSKKDIENVFSDEPNHTINTLIKLLSILNFEFVIPKVQQPKKAKNPVATKTKKKTAVRSRKKVIVPVIKSPSAQISKLARKSKSKK